MQSQLQTEWGAVSMMGFSHQAHLQEAWVDEALRQRSLPSAIPSFPGTPQVTFKSYSSQGIGGPGRLQETGDAALTEVSSVTHVNGLQG